MNLQFYIEKLNESDEFKNFKKENPKAYFFSGFFIIDKEGNDYKQHLDFYIPNKKQVFSFQLENNCKKVDVDQIPNQEPGEISESLEIDFDEIEEMINKKFEEKEIKNKIQKILLSLQRVEGKNYLLGTIFITGMGMIKLKIDLDENKITEFEKKSFMDMVNIFKKESQKETEKTSSEEETDNSEKKTEKETEEKSEDSNSKNNQ